MPLLRDDETNAVLWESNTILRYLAAQYGQRRLWVEEPALRAQGDKWMDWALSTLAPKHGPLLMGLVRTPPEQRDHAVIDAAKQALDGMFALLDDVLAKQPWLSGDAFGCGDIAVGPFILQPVQYSRSELGPAHAFAALVRATVRTSGVPKYGDDPGHLMQTR